MSPLDALERVAEPEPERARLGRGVLGRGWVVRGALEVTIGRSSIACSFEQIGQFWIRRLCRQKVGTPSA
ncbi:MAG TPA: hypothetical protein VMA96_00875 [Solirubrobacteraceae bacterium]|nr:hypothetical protein [Solirubrobacteraceae bacterium]